MAGVELGKSVAYTDRYDASLLQPIPRSLSRAALGTELAFLGFDLWHAYELSWLSPGGLPKVAIGEFRIPADSDCIVESKSFKYYLNSLNQTVFDSAEALCEVVARDVSAVVGAEVTLTLHDLDGDYPGFSPVAGRLLDGLEIETSVYQPDAALLSAAAPATQVQAAQVFSHLLKSNCPVTGQPDWATLWIQYSGESIDDASLLKYVVSFRQYEGFHESCVERIFTDLKTRFTIDSLCVYARYTRRGGLDINPIRVTPDLQGMPLPFVRTLRQ